jgi:hypothetical protein
MLILLRFQAAVAILSDVCAPESTEMRFDYSAMANDPWEQLRLAPTQATLKDDPCRERSW